MPDASNDCNEPVRSAHAVQMWVGCVSQVSHTLYKSDVYLTGAYEGDVSLRAAL